MFKKALMDILPVILLLAVVSCEEPFDYNDYKKLDYIVIQGWLTNEYKHQKISIYYVKSAPNDTNVYISNAYVIIDDGENIYSFKDSSSPGQYYSTRKFAATVEKNYYLTVKIDSNIYLAQTQVEPVVEPDTLELKYDSTRHLYRISKVAPIFNPYESALYIIYLDWSNVPGYKNLPYDSTHAKMYFYTLQTMDVNELFQPFQQQIFFPKGTQITEKKYSLTPFFASYIRALLSETQWSGSLFDVQHWNLPTNIKGHNVLGFFTASSVVSLTDTVK